MKIPKLKKLESKYKKGQIVYFYINDDLYYEGVIKGKISKVHKNITMSQGFDLLGRRTKPLWEVSCPYEYNIKTETTEYIQVQEICIYKNKDKALKNYKKYVFKPLKDRYLQLKSFVETYN